MNLPHDPIVIAAAKRTPLGAFQGSLATLMAPQLGAAAIKAALSDADISGGDVDELLMGCVLPAGVGQAPARQAAIDAGLPVSVPATTLNKVCGSGMKAIMLGCNAILAGEAIIVMAGGMESMSNAPYLLDKARSGMRIGHGRLMDHMYLDGLEDAYDKGRLMGSYAEDIAQTYQFTRAEQDAYAIQAVESARKCSADGAFVQEIVPVMAASMVSQDEGMAKAKPEKIPLLKPAFTANGTVTAATSASISDGAAALVLMRLSEAEKRGITPLAAIRGQASFAQTPSLFATAPIGAIRKLLERMKWRPSDVDLFEVNEAFAIVPMAVMHDFDIPREKMNIGGGACVLGHPLGASGARIVVTLLNALQRHGAKRGVASLCIGGGEATALALERF